MIIIDSPLTPSSSVREIEAWIQKLEELRRDPANDAFDLEMIDAALVEARGWLKT